MSEKSFSPSPAQAPVAWRDFGTAPKTGTPFLAFFPDADFSEVTGVEILWWEPSEQCFYINGEPLRKKPTLWAILPVPSLSVPPAPAGQREALAAEQWCTTNTDGSITLDAYAGLTREQLKDKCSDFAQVITGRDMVILELVTNKVSEHSMDIIKRLVNGYSDTNEEADTILAALSTHPATASESEDIDPPHGMRG